eukprot:TRINITY_DN4506_c0_g1_i2.p1 TRINITY_DN4506_c0_g1~~TRINITY_DN4506_c0_g1_i2.p1  ORF type:complete len:363 (-),score=75.61 TRINITY_DN4506_c0_g1_i2:83-1147(-)
MSENRGRALAFMCGWNERAGAQSTMSRACVSADIAAQIVNLAFFRVVKTITAGINQPHGLAVDSARNIYVADVRGNCVKKVTPQGVVSVVAGCGTDGYVDGSAKIARLRNPRGVCVDGSGNVFVADTENNAIRKITPEGKVSTVASDGRAGYRDHQVGEKAQLNAPSSVALDRRTNVLYVADKNNHCIRKITARGEVSTFAGSTQSGHVDGDPAVAKFYCPSGVAVDSVGNVLVADAGNNCIRKINTSGVVQTIAGSGESRFADGQGLAAMFNWPCALAVDGVGNVIVADAGNNRIRRISTTGLVTTIAGSGQEGGCDGDCNKATFRCPRGVAVDRGNVLVADTMNNMVRRVFV